MKFINLLILLFLCSCVNPGDLDSLENYAETKLESNIKEFSSIELKKWWEEHYKIKTFLILSNAKTFESSLELLDREINYKSSNLDLLSKLIKQYELNLSLRSLYQQNKAIEANWDKGCSEINLAQEIDLRNKIFNNYISGLRFPTTAETYMIGGGNGEDGLSKVFESLTTTLGTLVNHDQTKRIKSKIKKIKRLFNEKMPSEQELNLLSRQICLKTAINQKEFLDATRSLISAQEEKSNSEWKYYLSLKKEIGDTLLKRQLNIKDPVIQRKLSMVAKNELMVNLDIMRKHLQKMHLDLKRLPTLEKKEEFEDFVEAFRNQLLLLQDHRLPDKNDMSKLVVVKIPAGQRLRVGTVAKTEDGLQGGAIQYFFDSTIKDRWIQDIISLER